MSENFHEDVSINSLMVIQGLMKGIKNEFEKEGKLALSV